MFRSINYSCANIIKNNHSICKINNLSTKSFISKRWNVHVREMTIEEEEKLKLTKNRPISPHVSIYKFPLPAISSITHRITGVSLTAGIKHF